MDHKVDDFLQWAQSCGPEGVFRTFAGFKEPECAIVDWLMSWGVGIKICAPDVYCLFYDECPGMSGSGKMDWSMFSSVAWSQYLRLGFLVFEKDRARIIPGMTKSILSSQFRVNGLYGGDYSKLFPEDGLVTVITKTDGSSVQCLYIPSGSRWVCCTNRNSVVGLEFKTALDEAGSFDRLQTYLQENTFSGKYGVINLEVCTKKRLVTPHAPGSFYINYVWDEHSGVWDMPRIEVLRKTLRNLGFRCPRRFISKVMRPSCAEDLDEIFTSDLILKAVTTELKANPSVSLSEMSLCFEGFILKGAGVDLKWKHPTFRFLNKWMFNQSAEFQSAFLGALLSVPLTSASLVEKFPTLSGLCEQYGDVLCAAAQNQSKQSMQEITKVIKEELTKLNSLPVLDNALSRMTRKEIFSGGHRDRFEEACLAEKFKVALDEWIRNKRRLKTLMAIAKRFGLNVLLVALSIPVSLYRAKKPEPFSRTSMVPLEKAYVEKCAMEFTGKRAVLVDLDGTLLEDYPQDTHVIGAYASGSARLMLGPTSLAKHLAGLEMPGDTKLFVATGAKITEEELKTVLDKLGLKPNVGGCMTGIDNVCPWTQKVALVEQLKLARVWVCGAIDDHAETCRLLEAQLRVVLHYQEQKMAYKPQVIQMFGPPGTGKSQFCQSLKLACIHAGIKPIYFNRDQARLAGRGEGLDEANITNLMGQFAKATKTTYSCPTVLINDFMNIDLDANHPDGLTVFLLPHQLVEEPKVLHGPEAITNAAKSVVARMNPDVISHWKATLEQGIVARDESNSTVESTFHTGCLAELERLMNVAVNALKSLGSYGTPEIPRAIFLNMRLGPDEVTHASKLLVGSIQTGWNKVYPHSVPDTVYMERIAEMINKV